MKKDGIQTRKRKPKNPSSGGSMTPSPLMKTEKPGRDNWVPLEFGFIIQPLLESKPTIYFVKHDKHKIQKNIQ